jgi:pullulanase/glycogen debranching enzyme
VGTREVKGQGVTARSRRPDRKVQPLHLSQTKLTNNNKYITNNNTRNIKWSGYDGSQQVMKLWCRLLAALNIFGEWDLPSALTSQQEWIKAGTTGCEGRVLNKAASS